VVLTHGDKLVKNWKDSLTEKKQVKKKKKKAAEKFGVPQDLVFVVRNYTETSPQSDETDIIILRLFEKILSDLITR
jgi:hypothetical protein